MLCYWCIESPYYNFFSIISNPNIQVVVKETRWTNIDLILEVVMEVVVAVVMAVVE